MRRWIRRILFTLLILLILLIVGVQVLLSTDLPRKLLITTIEKQLGLRVTAGSLSISWFGHTTAKDVTLALPLSDQSFLKAPELEVTNTAIPWLMVGGKMKVSSLVFKHPWLLIRQDPQGRWNIQDVMALAGRAGGGQAAAPQAGAGRDAVQLPALAIQDATIVLQDKSEKQTTFSPVNVSGTPDGLLVWRLAASIGASAEPEVSVTGNFAARALWEHELKYVFRNSGQLLKTWFPDGFGTLDVKGGWNGRLANGGVTGQLRIEAGQIRSVKVGGVAGIDVADGKYTLRPAGLRIQVGNSPAQPVVIVGGSATFEGTGLSLDDITAQLMGGSMRVNGKADVEARSANLDSQWVNLAAPGGVSHQGSLHIAYTTPWPKQARIEGAVHSSGTASKGNWQADLAFNGTGEPGGNFDWTINAPQLHWDGSQHVHLDNLQATLQQRGPALTLRDVRTAVKEQVAGEAGMNLDTREWWTWLSIHDLPLLRRAHANTNIDLHFTGDSKHIDINKLDIFSGTLGATATGYYRWGVPKPLKLVAEMWRAPFQINNQGVPGESIGGDLWGSLTLEGELQPASLAMNLDVRGENVVFGQHKIGSPIAHLEGSADEDKVTLKSTQIDLLDGHWTLGINYLLETDEARAHISERDVSLKAINDFVAPPPDVTGVMSADLDVTLPEHDLRRLTADGEWHVTGLKKTFSSGQSAETTVVASSIDGKITYKEGSLKFNDIMAKNGEGRLNMMVQFDTGNRRDLHVTTTSKDWPVRFPNLALNLSVTSSTDVQINLQRKTLNGPIKVETPLTLQDKVMGTLLVDAQLQGRSVELNELSAQVFDGTFSANGVYLFDDWLNSHASYKLDHLNLAHVPQWIPQVSGIGGSVSGWGLITPDHDDRVPAPLRFNLALYPEGMHYNDLTFANLDLVAYASDSRFVVDRASWNMAGGNIHFNGRVTKPVELFGQLNLTLHDVDLNQIVKGANPASLPQPGRLEGSFSVFGPLHDKSRIFGDGDLNLHNTDLLNVGFISFLYDALGLKWGPLKPEGTGHIAMRLEKGTVHIPEFSYFNRGTQVRGDIDIGKIWEGKNATLDGYAVGSARPLRSVKLPFIADAEKVLSVLQQNVSVVKIGGTLGKPHPKLAPFSDIGSGLRRLLLGDLGAETKGSAG